MLLLKKARRMRKPVFVVAMLVTVLIAAVPALAQVEDFTVVPAEEPGATCGWVPKQVPWQEHLLGPGAGNPSDHAPGELMVQYYSEEAMWAAPQENVVHTSPIYYDYPSYRQLLRFEDIASIADPCERFAAEEAKRWEIIYSWPGVQYAEYNGYMYVQPAAEPG